jgi:hypothetical protein
MAEMRRQQQAVMKDEMPLQGFFTFTTLGPPRKAGQFVT